MCRAFVGINLADDASYDDYLKNVMLHYMMNGHNSGNHEGYTFASHDLEGNTAAIRTLDLNEVMSEGMKLPATNVIHGHARKASKGDTVEKYIHGWEFKGWTCSMNGTMGFNDGFDMPKDGNDSLHFFEMCFNDEHGVYQEDITQWTANIKKLAEETISHGNGALFFTNAQHTIVLMFNKTLTVHLMNRSMLVMNSNDDVHKLLDRNIELTLTETEVETVVPMGLLNFDSKQTTKDVFNIECEVPRMEDLKTEIKDSIIVFDNQTGEAIIHEKIKDVPYTKGFHRHQGTPYRGPSTTPKTTSVGPTSSKGSGKGKGHNSLDELHGKYMTMKDQLVASVEKEDNEVLADDKEEVVDLLSPEEHQALEDMKKAFPIDGDSSAREAYAQHILHDMDYI